jgi:hypothetical protein
MDFVSLTIIGLLVAVLILTALLLIQLRRPPTLPPASPSAVSRTIRPAIHARISSSAFRKSRLDKPSPAQMPAIRALMQQRLTFGGGDDAEKPPLRLARSLRLLAVAFAGDPARVDDLTALTEIAADPGSASDARADIGHSSPFAFVLHSAKFLGESDEKPFRSTDVAEPIRVFILDYPTSCAPSVRSLSSVSSMSSTANMTRR